MRQVDKKTSLILMVVGVLMLALGCYLTFFETRGYVAVPAVIERIERHGSYDNETFDVYVTYSVNGNTYHGRSDVYSGNYREGMEIQIYYNPDNPEEIHGDARGFGIYLLIAGPILSLVGVVCLFRRLA